MEASNKGKRLRLNMRQKRRVKLFKFKKHPMLLPNRRWRRRRSCPLLQPPPPPPRPKFTPPRMAGHSRRFPPLSPPMQQR